MARMPKANAISTLLTKPALEMLQRSDNGLMRSKLDERERALVEGLVEIGLVKAWNYVGDEDGSERETYVIDHMGELVLATPLAALVLG